jgi:peptidoglycan hydrolase CwlO-like protein
MSDLVQKRLDWTIADNATKAIEIDDLKQRIAELEAQVERMEKVLKERVPRSVYEAAKGGGA